MIYCNFARFDFMKICRRHISVFLFCLYILAVGILCFAKPDDLPSMTFDWFGLPADMIAHFLMFIPFPVLAYFAFVPVRRGKRRKFLCIIAIAIMAAVMALMTEKVQELLGYRSFEIKDLIADLSGTVAGTVAILAYIALKTEQK